MVNQNMPVEKTAEAIKKLIAESPFKSVTKFCWDNFRFTIEHHRISDWTVAIENVEKNELEEYLERISTINLAEVLNEYLV
jgi:uncharacterized protein YktB (UPF0637 family)